MEPEKMLSQVQWLLDIVKQTIVEVRFKGGGRILLYDHQDMELVDMEFADSEKTIMTLIPPVSEIEERKRLEMEVRQLVEKLKELERKLPFEEVYLIIHSDGSGKLMVYDQLGNEIEVGEFQDQNEILMALLVAEQDMTGMVSTDVN